MIDASEPAFGNLVGGVFGEVTVFGVDADFFHGFEAGLVFELIEHSNELVEFRLGDLRVWFDIAEFTRFAVGGLHEHSIKAFLALAKYC